MKTENFWQIYSTLVRGSAVWVPSRKTVLLPANCGLIAIWLGSNDDEPKIVRFKECSIYRPLRAFWKGCLERVEIEVLSDIPSDADPVMATKDLRLPEPYRSRLEALLLRYF